MLCGVQEGIYFITGKDIRDESLPFPFYQPGDHVYIGNPRHGRHVLPKRTQDAGLPGCRGILYILAFHKAKDGVGIKAGVWLWEPGKVTVKALQHRKERFRHTAAHVHFIFHKSAHCVSEAAGEQAASTGVYPVTHGQAPPVHRDGGGRYRLSCRSW